MEGDAAAREAGEKDWLGREASSAVAKLSKDSQPCPINVSDGSSAWVADMSVAQGQEKGEETSKPEY